MLCYSKQRLALQSSSLFGPLYPQLLHVDVFRLAQSFAVDQAHRHWSILLYVKHTCPSPKSFATLWIASPSDAVLAAAYSSFSAVYSDTTCCFLVHTFKQCPLLMSTPADTDRRVDLSPLQWASEHASSSPLCSQWNKHSTRGFPTRYLPILLTRSMSHTDWFAIAQHTCIDANLRSGRSCDK